MNCCRVSGCSPPCPRWPSPPVFCVFFVSCLLLLLFFLPHPILSRWIDLEFSPSSKALVWSLYSSSLDVSIVTYSRLLTLIPLRRNTNYTIFFLFLLNARFIYNGTFFDCSWYCHPGLLRIGRCQEVLSCRDLRQDQLFGQVLLLGE